jgi:anti-sigma B factor antagonist
MDMPLLDENRNEKGPLKFNQKDLDGSIIIEPLADALDYDNSNELQLYFEQQIQKSITNYILDMGQIERIDSSGLSVLHNISGTLNEHIYQLILFNTKKTIRHVLEVTHMTDTIPVFDELNKAISNLKK